jgi:uncharacterized membrane protein YesL
MEAKYNGENFVMKGLTIVYQIMALNILFIVFSVPMFTIGASLKALTGSVRDLLKGELTHEFKTFFYYFKSDFKKTTVSFLILAIGYIIVAYNFIMVVNVSKVGWMLAMIQIPVLVQLLFTHAMINYVHLEWDFKLLKSLKVAWVLGNRNMLKIVGTIGMAYLLIKLGLRIPMILIFFYIPLLSIIHYYFCYPLIKSVKGE